jgi:ferrochelatase
VLALPLYPHFSYATSGSSFQQLHGLLAAAGWKGRLSACRSYPDAPGYIDAMADRLEAVLASARPPPESTVILCSAHGLPQAYVERGDPYLDELHRTLEPLRGRFPGWRFELSFQSRVGPAEWLKPYTDRIIPQLAGQGVRHLVFVPLAFVNDHIETLYEVGVTYFALARAHGITPYRVPAVEDHPAYIQVLARAVGEWLATSPLEASPSQSLLPVEELLPPSQGWRRHGPWLAALGAAVLAGGMLWWIG